jgi:hypothetical protein
MDGCETIVLIILRGLIEEAVTSKVLSSRNRRGRQDCNSPKLKWTRHTRDQEETALTRQIVKFKGEIFEKLLSETGSREGKE